MKEPKATESATAVIGNVNLVYIKSEADRYIAWLKYKRCEAKIEFCKYGQYLFSSFLETEGCKIVPNAKLCKRYRWKLNFYANWRKKFKRLAEHYRELAK